MSIDCALIDNRTHLRAYKVGGNAFREDIVVNRIVVHNVAAEVVGHVAVLVDDTLQGFSNVRATSLTLQTYQRVLSCDDRGTT